MKKSSPLNFKPVLKAEKEELIQWIVQNCDLFKPFYKASLFLKRLKIEISGKVEGRKLLFLEHDDWNEYFYIIKSGNAFSWFGLNELDHRQTEGLIEKSVGEIKGKGIIDEIFCGGDVLFPELDLLDDSTRFNIDRLPYCSPIKGSILLGDTILSNAVFPSGKPFNRHVALVVLGGSSSLSLGSILSGIPFDKHIDSLVIIRISRKDLDKLISEKEFVREIATIFFCHVYHKLNINKWKLWGQWTNDRELKFLSILYLYFAGKLPLQCWITADKGEVVDNKGSSFQRPRCLIKEFEVGSGNLALFVGLTRQAIYHYLSEPRKTILGKDKELASLLNCRAIPGEEYKFSSPSPWKLLSYIQLKVESPIIKKYL